MKGVLKVLTTNLIFLFIAPPKRRTIVARNELENGIFVKIIYSFEISVHRKIIQKLMLDPSARSL